ncbi:rare lipoprotein A [Flavobacterium sp. 28YEA47A]|uniref:septal ring lytic transglycosylase RlpA family protein n=1 Tax=Flavobacterium sp. 28YEA47A TaxID=3156276 RepID=UPI00351217E1
MKTRMFLFIAAFGTLLTSCSSSKSVSGKVYKKNVHASYYADKFNGRKTASGEKFHNGNYTAAHKKLPFGTKVKVTNIANEKWVIVEINDRGPFTPGREIDLTKKAFMEIADSKNHGSLKVNIEIIK